MSRNGLWSALQTHLQGVDGTTLAIKPEIILHGVILLSRKGCRIEIPLPGIGGKRIARCAVFGGVGRPREPHPEVPRRGLEGRGGCAGGGRKEQRWRVSFEASAFGLRTSSG
ncbi:hypothetical protein B5K08_06300 [Rhizobium leguminosarum bv. trifolii]|uniref:Uncharacterized protein n=1 Tax=Rhizobium leguminosarum bv. trifolii TaxID=386 RepID=A0A3E1BVC2_RHILT|nr:hypothetical protein B5K08_06300 [Rhizobium leguminosarum bv. trifolii]RFB99030.1 hypothetical protein B5K10_06290 [Rhizobium leguminosarum bv. trifolii]